MPNTIHDTSPQQLLEEIHKKFLVVRAKEKSLRAERNEAVRATVAQGASVTHLARAGGISRELLHRILRAAPPAQPGALGLAGDGDGVAALVAIQKSLDATASKRATLEKQRAVAILNAVADAGATRTEIASYAGVSSETVRKTCLTRDQ